MIEADDPADDLADDLVVRAAAKAGATTGTLPAPARAAQVAEAEALLGFAIPPLLARLYTEVANGGFGPGYELFPLVGQGCSAVAAYQARRAESQAAPPRTGPRAYCRSSTGAAACTARWTAGARAAPS